MSIDALRGFDMMWIAGGATLVTTLDGVVQNSFTGMLGRQMHHTDVGLSFMDIIMPLFLFLTGCSVIFSFQRRLEVEGKRGLYIHTLKRVLILWILGLIYQGNLLSLDWSKIDLFSNTLQAIAIGYLGASLILLVSKIRWQIVITASLLVIYWLLMNFTPGYDLNNGTNLAIYIDKLIMKDHIGDSSYAWILPSLTFTVTVMMGVFTGKILTNSKLTKNQILKWITLFGIGLSSAGLLLTLHEPCIKMLWLSSFTLISGGVSVLLLALFYWIIDIVGYEKWALPYVWLGKNPILVYMIFAYNRFINLGEFANKFLYGLTSFLGEWYPLLINGAALLLLFSIFKFLDDKKIYIRV